MEFSGKPSTFEPTPAGPQRAGLRVAPTSQPSGLFEVIEMAVLVIVTALAMASIIVAGSEDDGRVQARGSGERSLAPPAREERRRSDDGAIVGSAERQHPTDVVAAR